MKGKQISMYDPFQIGGKTAKNRLIRSATFEFGAKDGRCTPEIVSLYRRLAEGGVGVIITGMTAVRAGGRTGPSMLTADDPEFCRNIRQIAEAAHEQNSLILVQLNHAGFKTARQQGYDRLGVTEQQVAEGALYRQMTKEDIGDLARAYGEAARRCQQGGCDGVQIHAGHGYLLHTFLSPYYNRRTDEYGGPIQNRARILYEIYDGIRAAVSDDFLVSVKLPFSDGTEPSITAEECAAVCRELERRGVGMLEITAGVSMDGGPSSFTPFVKDEGSQGAFLQGAALIAEGANIPVVSVAGYRTPDFIEKALNETKIAAVSLCRPLIRQPDLPNRWKTDRSPAQCVSCNRCFGSKGLLACQAAKE